MSDHASWNEVFYCITRTQNSGADPGAGPRLGALAPAPAGKGQTFWAKTLIFYEKIPYFSHGRALLETLPHWHVTISQQTWSGFSPTTVPDNNRQSRFSPTMVPKLSKGM